VTLQPFVSGRQAGLIPSVIRLIGDDLHLDARQAGERLAVGAEGSDQNLVFCTRAGATLDAANVRRGFRAVCKAAGIGEHWTPRELRHSFVSLMSSSGVPVEEIARIAGHSSTRTTEVVYRRELRPILTTGAEAMDRIFNPRAS